MRLYLLCLFTLFIVVINTQLHQANCPAFCNCIATTISDQCFICLEKQYKRNFLIQNKTCPCIQNYVQNYPPAEYCCAKNCTLCYWKGCYECRSNWTKTLNGAYYICVCKDYYKYDPILDDCICLGSYQQYYLLYYAPTRYLCYRCPQGCECSKSGCNPCEKQTNRQIAINAENHLWTCYCFTGYTEINGTCVRTESIKIPECLSPRILLSNGSCICNNPYYQDYNKDCKCKSILDPTQYYLYLDICYRCPNMCKCNEFGCIYCSILANRIIKYNHCTCVNDTGIFQQNGQCVCISPYNKTCYCNNIAYPSLFFINSNNQCKKCPYGCICDATGCVYCNQTSRRNNSCICKSPFLQLDGLCIVCPLYFRYVNNSCFCSDRALMSVYYYDIIQQRCIRCPNSCLCTENGCQYCNAQLYHRVNKLISATSQYNQYYTCYCDTTKHFRQNSQQQCQCIPPYIFNSTNNSCQCQPPYYIKDSKCICNSSIKYYQYSDTDCRPCPLECNCSTIGCYKCSTKTNRIILTISFYKYICPCFPIQKIINQAFCVSCKQDQYLWLNGQCVNCDPNCKTCNENGCLTCESPMILSNITNNTCICSNNLYYNEGSCICPQSYFLNLNSVICVVCPQNCLNCQFNDQVQNMIECIECNITAFRKNNPSQQCPCIDYYVEGNSQKSFCCHQSCKDCNISGCISCIQFSHRQLNYNDKNNVTCTCMNGFVQTYYVVCSCPPQMYLYYNKCQACPSYCLKCSLVLEIISCNQCINGLNRINQINQQKSTKNISSIIYDCKCAAGYQSYTNQTHCYPKSCLMISDNGLCAICGANRIQTRNVSYCNCTTGFYQDQSYTCQSCFEGCIKCISYDICEKCDVNNNYYLVFNKKQMVINCIKPDFSAKIFYQEKGNTILQIKGINNTNNSYVTTKNLSIYLIVLTQNVSISTIKLNLLKSDIINTNILVIRFNNLTKDQLNPFLLYINSTDQHGIVFQKYYLMEERIYTKATISYSGVQEIFIYLLITLIMIASFVVNILGEKHNQLMYYCQTIYFIAMNVKDSHMYLVPILDYFRITTFNFTFEDSGSPFNFLRSNWSVYFQKSYGNYRYFSIDSNLIRNVGLALYLAIQNQSLEIIFRIIYAILFRSKHKMFVQKYKKVVYRSLQWMRKVTMYPLLFFSLSTLILYQREYSLTDQSFRQLNRSYAIGILIFYTLNSFLQFIFEQISKIYKYELLIEYFFNIVNSIIIITSSYSQYILFVLIPLMILKSVLQHVKSRVFMYKPNTIYKYIIILNLIQSLIIIPIYFCNLIGTLTLILFYILGILIFRLHLIKKKYEVWFLEKKIGKIEIIEEGRQNTTQKIVEIKNMSQEILSQ